MYVCVYVCVYARRYVCKCECFVLPAGTIRSLQAQSHCETAANMLSDAMLNSDLRTSVGALDASMNDLGAILELPWAILELA